MDDARKSNSLRTAARRVLPTRVPWLARGAATGWLTVLGMVVETWPPGAGALVASAAIAALTGVWLGVWAIPGAVRREDDRLDFDAPRRPGACEAWLHIVSGGAPRVVAQGAMELCAQFLEDGHRVLVVDGGRRLHLEQWFGREARWGFGECLVDAMPVLGVVQDTGCAGLLLLARGSTAGAEGWSQLGRVLDETRPHFGRVVLALDLAAPREAGQALSGRYLEGWWAGGGALPMVGRALSERLGIRLLSLELTALPDVQLEAIRARPVSARTSALEAEFEGKPPRPPEPAAVDPILDCDLRVRERLRFLLWVRCIRSRTAPAAHAFEGGAVARV